jgi:hypothetical protein
MHPNEPSNLLYPLVALDEKPTLRRRNDAK